MAVRLGPKADPPCEKRLVTGKCTESKAAFYKACPTAADCQACPFRQGKLSVAGKATAFGKFVGATTIAKLRGQVTRVSSTEQKRREAICAECPSDKRQGNWCTDCSCNLTVKTQQVHTDCRLGHWKSKPRSENEGEQ